MSLGEKQPLESVPWIAQNLGSFPEVSVHSKRLGAQNQIERIDSVTFVFGQASCDERDKSNGTVPKESSDYLQFYQFKEPANSPLGFLEDELFIQKPKRTRHGVVLYLNQTSICDNSDFQVLGTKMHP